MNGRIYDAHLGRFMQADPFVDGVTNTQGYNRYAYVHNNPLNASDPSGYFSFKDVLKIAVVAVLSVVTYGAAAAWAGGMLLGTSIGCSVTASMMFTGAIAGAASGFVGAFSMAAMNGASASDAFKAGTWGAMSGALFGGIGGSSMGFGGKVFSHAMGGGVMNVLQGGKFGHGFISAGITKFASVKWISGIEGSDWGRIAGRTTVATVVGGTTSAITGGKFANGARTAAFQHLFNQESGALRQKLAQKSKVNFIYETDGLDKFKAAAEKYAEHYEGILPPGEHDVHVYLENFKSGDHMMQAPNGVTIWVAPDYADHPLNIVGTAIGHELVHLRDHLDPSMNMRSSFTRNSSELNAYQWNLDNAKEFNLPLQYKSYFRQKKQQYY